MRLRDLFWVYSFLINFIGSYSFFAIRVGIQIMENVVDFAQKHNAKIQGSLSTIASMGLDKTASKSLGPLVTPAVWTTNYVVNGAVPDSVDIGLFISGLFGGTFAIPSTIVGLFKSAVDDRTNQQVRAARAREDVKYRKHILPCAKYSWNPPEINAMTIASKGGTAWLHPNGVWLFILDENAKYVHNFEPNNYIKLYRPKSLERKSESDRFSVAVIKKTGAR